MWYKIRYLTFFLVVFLLSVPVAGSSQEVKVNQKKIERERAKKNKKDVKQYEKAVKRHKTIQTKSTRASMKQTKKESAKATPVKR